ncbi:hypothetical protein FF011L_31790 [Roseimaritima multifibrata]|uniref:PEP-CTERM protein-sorting domain-containing protein n=1 Tax=Roseimaritima multifibrata TaxID=1930274 RepID=A0A517MHP1_9BACT|nr:hypothetical protein [Roseimaritima multifibrata]QDS94400.1 hypothetical protein FF011L_31790 [Roseimaritima multifibrata]
MKYSYLSIILLLSGFTGVQRLDADIITGGSLEFQLDASAFETNPSQGFLDFYNNAANDVGSSGYDTSQPHMVFGRHTGPGDTSDPSLPPGDIGNSIYRFRPSATTASFDDLRSTYVTPTSPIVTPFAINGNDPIAKPHGTRNPQQTTLEYNPNDILASMSGAIGFDGATSFWYGVEEAIAGSAIWIGYGDLDLKYDANRAVNGLSGLYFSSHIAPRVGQTIYDTTITSISAIAADGGTPGSLTITGELYATSDFDGVGLKAGTHVGSYSLSGVSSVPEPTSLIVISGCALGGVLVRFRSRGAGNRRKPETNRCAS